MGQAQPQADPGLTHQEYFDLEQAGEQRYEYLAGEVFAMGGGSEAHALIGMNVGTTLNIALRNHPCRIYGSDLKVYIAEADKFCYPDVMVSCGEGARGGTFVEDPVLIVEVLSDSTESYDRGLKFEHYRSIPGLRHYLLLSQHRPHAELFTRVDATRWRFEEVSGEGGRIPLETWDLELEMAELYRNAVLGGTERQPPDAGD